MSMLIERGYIEERLFPVVLIDGRDATSLEEYKKYWNEEFEKRREIVSTSPAGGLKLAIEELYYCDAIVRELPKLWSYIAKYNTSTIEQLKENGYKTLIDSINDKFKGIN